MVLVLFAQSFMSQISLADKLTQPRVADCLERHFKIMVEPWALPILASQLWHKSVRVLTYLLNGGSHILGLL